MKFYLDTEFIEGFHFVDGVQTHHVELISIGIVSEDYKTEYYAINNFRKEWAGVWVSNNVINQLEDPEQVPRKGIQEIRYDLLALFFREKNIEFWGYYADYDWVVFCSVFGTMINLPEHFPMFCMDLKQLMQSKGLDEEWKKNYCPEPEGEHNALVDAKWNRRLMETIDNRVWEVL